MERNEVTKIGKLAIGDRFYKLKDKKKIAWEKVDAAAVRTYYKTYRNFAIHSGITQPQPMDKYTEVVFLRRPEAHEKKTFITK